MLDTAAVVIALPPPPASPSLHFFSLCEIDSRTNICCTAQHLQRCRRVCGSGRIIARTVHAGADSARALPLPAQALLLCFQAYTDARWPAVSTYSTPQRALPLPPAPLLPLPLRACIHATAHRCTLQHPRAHVCMCASSARRCSQSHNVVIHRSFSCSGSLVGRGLPSCFLPPSNSLAPTHSGCTAATTFCSSLSVRSVHHSRQISTPIHPHSPTP